jgi:putative transposase
MARPGHNANPQSILSSSRTFFATSRTYMGKRLLQSERNAGLLIDVLRTLVAERRITMHDFVIMPDHIHLLMTVDEDFTIEKAMQLIKGRFSYRLSHECEFNGEVWQRGFSEEQVMGAAALDKCRQYIAENPLNRVW